MKLKSAKPLNQTQLLSLLLEETTDLKEKLGNLSQKFGDGKQRFVFRSVVPKAKGGVIIAEIRNNISHARCSANSLNCELDN